MIKKLLFSLFMLIIIQSTCYADESEDGSYTFIAEVTAYTANDEEGTGNGITASGEPAIEGVTIAMEGVPFGTLVDIDGHIYTVQDRFGHGEFGYIDIFMNDYDEAMDFGRQFIEVTVLN